MINKITGEILTEEEEKTNNMIANVEVNGIITEEVADMFEQFAIMQHRIENWEYENKSKIIEIMKATGTKSIHTDYLDLTYIAPSVSKIVDTEKMKADGIYENYLKDSNRKESLRIKYKEA